MKKTTTFRDSKSFYVRGSLCELRMDLTISQTDNKDPEKEDSYRLQDTDNEEAYFYFNKADLVYILKLITEFETESET